MTAAAIMKTKGALTPAESPLAKPTPIFTKLDPGVVEEELERFGA